MSSIFISYRRDETKDVAGRLYDRLTTIFGKQRVFRDIYTIPGGADFPSRIKEAVASAKVVIVLIGDRWSTIKDSQNRRRIDDPADWVRLEVATALEHDTLVVPVLVEDAKMPAETELPDPLRRLVRHHAIELSDRRFEADVEELIKVLREQVAASAGTQLVTLLATDAWQATKAAVASAWRRVHPERAELVEAELVESWAEVVAARAAGDTQGEQALASEWQGRLRRLFAADAEAATELLRALDKLAGQLPETERVQIGTIGMSATVTGQGRVYQVGQGSQHITER